MQIRRRKARIELIRIQYDSSIGRSRSRLLGSVAIETLAVDEPLLAVLTQDERLQLDAYLAPLRVAADHARQADAAAQLPELIAAATAWYSQSARRDAEVVALARATRDAFSALLAAQVRAGVGRTRRRTARP